MVAALLIARNAKDRNPCPEEGGGAEVIRAIAHFGQQRLGDVEQLQNVSIPAVFVNIEKHGAPKGYMSTTCAMYGKCQASSWWKLCKLADTRLVEQNKS